MTKIEWTRGDDGSPGKTIQPVRGCTRISPGCGGSDGGGCYAERMAHRFSGPGGVYEGLTRTTKHGPRWTNKLRLDEGELAKVHRWRKPRRIFVSSMGDLFHEKTPTAFLDRVFAHFWHSHMLHRIARLDPHVFIVLTKRAERMRDYLCDQDTPNRVGCEHATLLGGTVNGKPIPMARPPFMPEHLQPRWPIPGVWCGVSVEDQTRADERIPVLLKTPAALRFLSVEPLLGHVDLSRVAWDGVTALCVLEGQPRIDWVIIGGESGPVARPCDIAWVRSIVSQCRSEKVQVFVKQLGARPYEAHAAFDWCCDNAPDHPGKHPLRRLDPDGISRPFRDHHGGDMEEWPEDLRVREFPS